MSERDHEALSDILGVLDRALVLAPLMSGALAGYPALQELPQTMRQRTARRSAG
jgi:hypothetical protein